MTDLETRLRGDLAELADAITADEPAAWEQIRSRAAADGPGTAPLLAERRERRPRRLMVWVAAGVVAAAGITAVVTLAIADGDDSPTVPATGGPPSVVESTTAAPDGIATLQYRVASLPAHARDQSRSVTPAVFNHVAMKHTVNLLRRDDGAWARVELDVASFDWQHNQGLVASGRVSEIALGATTGLLFQEYGTTWVVMFQTTDGTVTVRSGGLDQAAVLQLARALATESLMAAPDGWESSAAVPDWTTVTSHDQFGIATTVYGSDGVADLEPEFAALDLADAGATVEPIRVAGSDGWAVSSTPANRLAGGRAVVWERDGMVIALARTDAGYDELVAAAGDVELAAASGEPVQSAGSTGIAFAPGTVRADGLLILDEGTDEQRGDYQWRGYRYQAPDPETGRTKPLWCVEVVITKLSSGSNASACQLPDQPFTAVAAVLDGDAGGMAAGDVRDLWFVVDGQRVDVSTEDRDGYGMFRATLPDGQRTSLHVVTADGTEVAGAIGLVRSGCNAACAEAAAGVLPTTVPG